MDIEQETIQTKNTKTGKVTEGFFVYVAYPKQKIKGNRWYMTFQDSLALIAEDRELTGQTLRVWMILMSELEFENYITIKQKEIATRLEMYQPDVSKAINLLVKKEIILKIKDGSTTGYKLNPTYGWKGKVENMDKEKERILKQKVINFEQAREVLAEKNLHNAVSPDEVPY